MSIGSLFLVKVLEMFLFGVSVLMLEYYYMEFFDKMSIMEFLMKYNFMEFLMKYKILFLWSK